MHRAAAAAAAFLPTQTTALVGSATRGSGFGRAGGAGRVVGRERARGGPVPVFNIDAAQPFDFEAKQRDSLEEKRRQERKLKIGIVGFGNFGQFLAKRFIKNGHEVIATSRGDYGDIAKDIGAEYFRDPDDFCEMHPDVVIFWQGRVDEATCRDRRCVFFPFVLSSPRSLFRISLAPQPRRRRPIRLPLRSTRAAYWLM